MIRQLVPLLAILLLGACNGLDPEHARICESLLPALEPRHEEATGIRAEKDSVGDHTVAIWYRLESRSGMALDHWIRCTFAGGGFDRDRRRLVTVQTDRDGTLGPARLFMLRCFWLRDFEARGSLSVAPDGDAPGWVYFLQQGVNAITVGCVYALLAIAYTLVFGLIRRINMAFGEIAMVGAFVAILSIYLFAVGAGFSLIATIPLATGAAALTAGLYGWTAGRVVIAPLLHRPAQTVLVATVGVAIFLQEFVHRSQEVNERWLQPVFSAPHVLAAEGGFTVVATTFKIALVVLVGVVFGGLLWLMARSGFGRAWRACADDAGMAALCGVNTRRTSGATFLLGGAFAGLAGTLIALLYGAVNIHMGIVLGFKALTAAIVGGIGSLPGALIGGLLVAVVETFWSAYFTLAYRDVTVFALLALVLIYRPDGLFGWHDPRDRITSP